MSNGSDASQPKTIDGFVVNVEKDSPDFRDYKYEPALIQLKDQIKRPAKLNILDQGQEGACTGFGLAAVINLLLSRRNEDRTVSARMLYEMARKFDEWGGEDYSGSSCRGAVRGWDSMGVCSDGKAAYTVDETDWDLSIERAVDARVTTLGAYYRVSHRLSDYHAALNEVGALYVSARVHEGWQGSQVSGDEIPFKMGSIGGHAFAIVGYNQRGFWVQNSWGEGWGEGGVALWLYEDWLQNVKDAWVLRLAVSTPQIWHLTPKVSDKLVVEEGAKRSPKRAEIVGHFVHIDDGKFDERGKYWTSLASVKQTAEHVATSQNYDHLLLYAHGGLNSVKASARRVVAMKEVFKKNRVYPFHFMYDTGLLEEIKDIVLGKKSDVEARAGGFTDFTDRLVEKATRRPGRALWREMKSGARSPFEADGAGTATIRAFLDAFGADGARPKQLHIVGHSTGAILLAALLRALWDEHGLRIRNCMLLAPACPNDTFHEDYAPLLHRPEGEFGIDQMVIYSLTDKLEREDTVAALYRKSLLYLVSNAFEEDRGEPILGMQAFRDDLEWEAPDGRKGALREEVSDGSGGATASTTHGGFDNDVHTMNDVLATVLGEGNPVNRPFTERDLAY